VNIAAIGGLVRHALTTAAGAAAAAGYLAESDVSVVVGGVMALIGVAWSIYEKKAA
jgi:hypothetical protein